MADAEMAEAYFCFISGSVDMSTLCFNTTIYLLQPIGKLTHCQK